MEWSVRLPVSNLVAPILVGAQATHCGIYIVSHVVGHDAPRLLRVNVLLPLLEGHFLHTKHLGEIELDFRRFIISYHM